ncbi:hypothetical protein HDU80_001179 [Chytriomyces hyalinus]|nr:hypothetical protein HDU80_001179 [Chytriomyces hyalinus]
MSDPTITQKLPSQFSGASAFKFNIFMKAVRRYAQSKGLDAVFEPTWCIDAPYTGPAETTLYNHLGAYPKPPEDGQIPDGAVQHWEARMKLYNMEKSDNKEVRSQREHRATKRKEQEKENERAIGILNHCFPINVMQLVASEQYAHEKVSEMRRYYSNGITNDAKGQWQTLWEAIEITDDNTSFEIAKCINKIVDLVDEHQSIYGSEERNDDLLTFLTTKFNKYRVDRREFNSIHTKIDTEGAEGFCPDQIRGDPPEGAPDGTVGPLVNGAHHYSLGVTNFMNLLHQAVRTMFANERSKGIKSEESAKQATAAATVTTGKPKTKATKGTKNCSHHGVGAHDTSECNHLKRLKKTESKKEKGPSKVAKAKVAKSKSCGMCKKKHSLKDCPNIKSVLKLVAKSAEESDSESVASDTAALAAKPSKGKAVANGAIAVISSTKTIRSQGDSWQPFFESNEVLTNDLLNLNPLALQVRKTRTVLDSGASAWMCASIIPFEELVLTKEGRGGYVNLADGSASVPIEGYGSVRLVLNGLTKVIKNALYVPRLAESLGSINSLLEGTNDTVTFSVEDVYYTTSDKGITYHIGKRCGDLYYLHASNSSPVAKCKLSTKRIRHSRKRAKVNALFDTSNPENNSGSFLENGCDPEDIEVTTVPDGNISLAIDVDTDMIAEQTVSVESG